jgi:hypothetical protein
MPRTSAIVATCAVLLHVASATARGQSCPPAHAKVIAAGGAARAYRTGRDLYGCYPGVRRVHFGVTKDRSGASPYSDYDTNVTIAGRYLAFHERDQEPDNSLTFRIYVIRSEVAAHRRAGRYGPARQPSGRR